MKTRQEKKFTLIELLVVIGIIALLAALLFPAIGSVRKHAKKVKAQATVTALKTAISQYEAQYGLMPFNYTTAAGKDLIFRDGSDTPDTAENVYLGTSEYDELIDVLSCVDVDGNGYTNARKTRFLTGLPASGTTDDERTLTDPYKISGQKYGKRIAIAVDMTGDNKVKINGQELNGKIFIWSFGADGDNDWGAKTGTDNDDVPSWE